MTRRRQPLPHLQVREAMRYLRGRRDLKPDPRDQYIADLERVGDELAAIASGAVFYTNDGHADLEDQQDLDKLVEQWDEMRGQVLRKVKARRTRERNKRIKPRS
jgi:phosphate uptake regulator